MPPGLVLKKKKKKKRRRGTHFPNFAIIVYEKKMRSRVLLFCS